MDVLMFSLMFSRSVHPLPLRSCVPHLPLQDEKQHSLNESACMARVQGK